MYNILYLLMFLGLCKQLHGSGNDTSSTNVTFLENNSSANSFSYRVLRSYNEHDYSPAYSKSNSIHDNSFLHLGVGAILSLSIMFFRTYIPNLLMRLMGRSGRSMPNSDPINWHELGRYVFEKSDDPLAHTLNAMMEARVKSKLKINATVGESMTSHCVNQLLCQTTKEAARFSSPNTPSKQKLQLLLRSAVLLVTLQSNSFFDMMHPITAGQLGYNCSKQFPLCNWKLFA